MFWERICQDCFEEHQMGKVDELILGEYIYGNIQVSQTS